MSAMLLLDQLRLAAPNVALPPLPVGVTEMDTLAALYGLAPFDVDLVVLASLPELHEGWGDLFAALGSAWRRPTVGLALRILVPRPEQRARVGSALLGSPALRRGLIRVRGPDLPEPDQALHPSPVIPAWLHGATPRTLTGTGTVREVDPSEGRLLLDARPSLRAVVERLATHPEPLIVHIGEAPRGGALELAMALAVHLGRGLLRVRDVPCSPEAIDDLAHLAGLTDRVLFVEGRPDARTWALDAGPGAGVMILSTAAGAVVEADTGVVVRAVDVPGASPPEMVAAWRALAPEIEESGQDGAFDALSNYNRLPLSTMRRAVERAREDARIDGRALAPKDLMRSVGAQWTPPATGFATADRPSVPWEALVVPDGVREQLEEVHARVVYRMTVQYRWGMASPSRRGDGVVCLLHGDSGVGKTFAAEVLASSLALPLLKVDLSRVVSKYIGETEKNLEMVYDQAEGFACLLMFDEADAVFGKRTAVQDAHDRYANLETNYLLQRLERFEGVALLATNLLKNIDPAFLRRMHAVVHMPRPAAGLRRTLWELSLPHEARASDVDFAALATRFDVVGGEIRNAALRAAYAAAAEGARVSQAHLLGALRAELAKKGRPFPER